MKVKVKFTKSKPFIVNLSADKFKIKFNNTVQTEKIIGQDIYKGKYKVIPTIENQTLQTKDKQLLDNILVTSVPYSSVINDSGGNTITIL